MNDIICIARGIRIDPQRLDRDLPLLEDVKTLSLLLELMEKMKNEVKTLTFSDEALTIYQAASSAAGGSDPLDKTLRTIEATIKTLEAVKGKKKKEKFSEDRKLFARMAVIVSKTSTGFSKLRDKLSTATVEVYLQLLSAEKEPSATLKLISALKSTIVNSGLKLSPANRQRLGIGKPDWAERISAGAVDKMVGEKCAAAEIKKDSIIENTASLPATQPLIKPATKNYDYSLRLGSGYGTGRDQTLLTTGGISARYRMLQIDYSGKFYALTDIRSGTDDASAIVKFKQGQVQAGWSRFKSSVKESDPDQNGAYLRGRQIFPLGPINLHLDEELFSGQIAGKWQTIGAARPGVSWKGIFAGAAGGYDTQLKKPVYGGFLGAGKTFGRIQFDILADYTNTQGINPKLRCFFDTSRWGAGPTVDYLYSFDRKEHKLSAGLFGRIGLGKFHFLPFVQGTMQENELKTTSGIEAGFIVRFGSLQLARSLRPYSLDPLPEGQ